jgi:hypothetical protein
VSAIGLLRKYRQAENSMRSSRHAGRVQSVQVPGGELVTVDRFL